MKFGKKKIKHDICNDGGFENEDKVASAAMETLIRTEESFKKLFNKIKGA